MKGDQKTVIKEELVLYKEHVINAAAPPTLNDEGFIVYELGDKTYLIISASKGAFLSKDWNDHHTWLGDLETQEDDLNVWLEEAFYMTPPPERS